jgi:DUF917 family protein
MLMVDYTKRYNIKDVNNYIYNKINRKIVDRNKELHDIINCKENNHKKNEKMKQHVVKKTIATKKAIETKKHKEEENSWEKINKSSSLIMKMSIKGGFLDWLLKK